MKKAMSPLAVRKIKACQRAGKVVREAIVRNTAEKSLTQKSLSIEPPSPFELFWSKQLLNFSSPTDAIEAKTLAWKAWIESGNKILKLWEDCQKIRRGEISKLSN